MPRFSEVFFVDATSANTITTDFQNIAHVKEAGELPQDALSWLARQHEEWLLLFNNADDAKLNLRKYFPSCSHGNILITSRNHDTRLHAPSPQSNYNVSNLAPDDARCLLLAIVGHRDAYSKEPEVLATAIVKVIL
jgi:hypothetical protein